MPTVRNTGGSHRAVSGKLVQNGETFEATESEAKAFSDKFEVVDNAPSEPEPEPDPVAEYHTGGGYYTLPGGERVRGKDAAIDALAASEGDDGADE